MNHKRTGRVYREEKLSLWLKKQAKRPGHLRVAQPGPTRVDLWDRTSPTLETDDSLTGQRVVRVLDGSGYKDVHRIMAPDFPKKPWTPGHMNTGYGLNLPGLANRWIMGTSKALMVTSAMIT